MDYMKGDATVLIQSSGNVFLKEVSNDIQVEPSCVLAIEPTLGYVVKAKLT